MESVVLEIVREPHRIATSSRKIMEHILLTANYHTSFTHSVLLYCYNYFMCNINWFKTSSYDFLPRLSRDMEMIKINISELM